MTTGISGWKQTRKRNSGSHELEPELTFVDPVPVKPELELHLEIPVPVKRTGTVVLDSQLELNYSGWSIYCTYFHTKTEVIYSFLFN
jgi:hypothetical protein